jgi:transposase
MLQQVLSFFCGMDLHSNNTLIGIIDEAGKKIFRGRFANKINVILKVLEPYADRMKGIVVESTFNWYFLVDGLKANSYKVHLAHPAANQQYKGLKRTNDKTSAFWLAELLRLNILKEGYIFPIEERHLRDLARKRTSLVQNRTQYILSFESLVNRNLGVSIDSNAAKKLKEADIEKMFDNEHLILTAKTNIAMMRCLGERVKQLEKEILKAASLKVEFQKLITTPGIGKVLAITIALDTGTITRFDEVGNYVSYCRCADSECTSNSKRKGQNNRKNGNKYLAWAYLEAAHKMRRYCPQAESYYQDKLLKTKEPVVAIKSLAAKIARACYYIMKDQVDFDVTKMFAKQ